MSINAPLFFLYHELKAKRSPRQITASLIANTNSLTKHLHMKALCAQMCNNHISAKQIKSSDVVVIFLSPTQLNYEMPMALVRHAFGGVCKCVSREA